MSKTVWTFTNKKELNKSEFINYFERKVFKVIRQNDLLPDDKIFTLKESKDLNTTVLKKVIEKKFEVKFSTKPNLVADNLSQEAEDIFKQILKGDFKKRIKKNAPLAQLSDKEVVLYAELTGIKGTSRKRDEKIQSLFAKFLRKNQDLEVNVVKAIGQLN